MQNIYRLQSMLNGAGPEQREALNALPTVQMASTLSQLSDSLSKWAAANNASVDAKLREYNEALDGDDLRLSAIEVARKVFLQDPEAGLPSEFVEDMSHILAPDLDHHERPRGVC